MGIRVSELVGGNRTIKIPAGKDKKGKDQFLTVVYTPEKASGSLMSSLRKITTAVENANGSGPDGELTPEEAKDVEFVKRREEAMYLQFDMTALFVYSLLVEWDLMDDDGKPYPINADSISKLPSGILAKIMTAINSDTAIKK